jgi:hypothetical protein
MIFRFLGTFFKFGKRINLKKLKLEQIQKLNKLISNMKKFEMCRNLTFDTNLFLVQIWTKWKFEQNSKSEWKWKFKIEQIQNFNKFNFVNSFEIWAKFEHFLKSKLFVNFDVF